MLERLGVLEDDVRTARAVAAELARTIRLRGLWRWEHEHMVCCHYCAGTIDKQTEWRALLALQSGEIEFPHTDACPYAAGLRFIEEDARGD